MIFPLLPAATDEVSAACDASVDADASVEAATDDASLDAACDDAPDADVLPHPASVAAASAPASTTAVSDFFITSPPFCPNHAVMIRLFTL